jgi:hypothetical protein
VHNLAINIVGSSGTPYVINAGGSGDELVISCSCPAGESGKFCKHVGQLLEGDFSSISDSSEKTAATQLMISPEARNTLQKYALLRASLESQLKAEALAKKAAAKLKKEMFALISPKRAE